MPRFAGRRHRIDTQIATSRTWREVVVHHEDIRRAAPGWTPRALDERTVGALRRLTQFFAPFLIPGVPARVTLRTEDGAVLASFGAGSQVTVTGAPGESLLFAFGRNEVRVDIRGDADVIEAVRHTERRF